MPPLVAAILCLLGTIRNIRELTGRIINTLMRIRAFQANRRIYDWKWPGNRAPAVIVHCHGKIVGVLLPETTATAMRQAKSLRKIEEKDVKTI